MALTEALIGCYDKLNSLWEKHAIERGIGLILLCVYLITLVAVEANRMGFYPEFLPAPPDSLYFAIQLAFSLILCLEIISLIFIMPASLSKSMGKQLEILTLILLRNAFKELSVLPEPISVSMDDFRIILEIGALGLGAFGVFMCLGFYRVLGTRRKIQLKPKLLKSYVDSKKILALSLLVLTVIIAINDATIMKGGAHVEFFETIYTVLIFADIAMVLIAQRYMPCYYAVFRNSGFVIGTLLMRLALSAPAFLCAGIAVFAALYILALTWGTNYFSPDFE